MRRAGFVAADRTTDYQDSTNGVQFQTLMNSCGDEIRSEILEPAPRYSPFNTYGDGIRTVQRVYLARCTERLYGTILRALRIELAGAATRRRKFRTYRPTMPRAGGSRGSVTGFARNPALVRDAKAAYGYRCQACGFDFRER